MTDGVTTEAGPEPRAQGEGFNCGCGRDMTLERIDPRERVQVWTCDGGCTWLRDLSEGEWREAL